MSTTPAATSTRMARPLTKPELRSLPATPIISSTMAPTPSTSSGRIGISP